MTSKHDFEYYRDGNILYGDDFNIDEICYWHETEIEGYADIVKKRKKYQYNYHALNIEHGYKKLPKNRTYDHALGFGSAFGDEFLPIANYVRKLTIMEPSDVFIQKDVYGIPTSYVKPNANGKLPFENDEFDLITCLGVLHHIPNVSFVINEFYQCLKPNGFALIREPIVSQGDWNGKRKNLTKYERGIPFFILKDIVLKTGFTIISENICIFTATSRLAKIFKTEPWNSKKIVMADHLLSRLFFWNYRYHATKFTQKIMPVGVFYVLQKIVNVD